MNPDIHGIAVEAIELGDDQRIIGFYRSVLHGRIFPENVRDKIYSTLHHITVGPRGATRHDGSFRASGEITHERSTARGEVRPGLARNCEGPVQLDRLRGKNKRRLGFLVPAKMSTENEKRSFSAIQKIPAQNIGLTWFSA